MTDIQIYKKKLKELGCIVVIPTYNNERTLAKVIEDVRQFSEDIMVVNDGSTDSTSRILSQIQDIVLLSYKQNMGKGYALKLGLSKAFDMGFKYAITIDSDGQHYADDIPVFIDRIEQVPGSLLIGARNLHAENMPSKNTFANKFSNFWYTLETGRKLSDTQSGYRLYPLGSIQNIRYFTSRYEFEVEIIVRAAWRGVNVENIPIKVLYPEDRVSHFRPFKDFFRIGLLNSVLVLYAFLVYYPFRFVKSLTLSNIKEFFNKNVIHSKESNFRMAAAMGWGIFCGIIPFWGYQMIFAGFTAHLMKLNKVVAVVFSNISIPPMIPFILYGSVALGAFITGAPLSLSFEGITLDKVKDFLFQYMTGSFSLAIISGICTTFISWILMIVFKRGRANG